MLPQSNGILTAIKGGGFTEDYDQPEGTDPVKWSGSIEIYVKESVKSQVSGSGELNRAKDTRLILPGDVDISFSVGDTVVYTYSGRTWTRIIEDWDDARMAGVEAHEVVHLHLYASDQDSSTPN